MLVSFKVGALALVLFGACEADTGATATAEPRPDDAPTAGPAPGPPQRSEQAKTPAPERSDDYPEPGGDHAERGDVYLELTVPQPRYWLGEPVTLVASV